MDSVIISRDLFESKKYLQTQILQTTDCLSLGLVKAHINSGNRILHGKSEIDD